tara:strand:+ start:148 stop:576 length:429 start_codon:yes stop_codon:yes gene_type:complete
MAKKTDKNGKEWISFLDETDGKRYMICRVCEHEYITVGQTTVAVTCSMCVQRRCLNLKPIEEFFAWMRKKKSTGRPAGWHFMNEFVDKDGTVFHKGKEQPELKGTLPPTKIKPPKKRKKVDKDKELFKLAAKHKRKRKLKKK